ncbi:hypothetical protein Pse7367_3303 [Thalassoporum mexicanum PCC 7367]|uniref:DUF6761 family protein n=1 Tax=Thalassoporum mexicanum TaxID=3457544 RepID=UPI00029FBB21|nr:DUF6761 family protein [Pseudanabaena sp. PCC 7367]AFY71543.1 hypothetical protein Pse7367_3303 [Pseudanabaena sp. PCC 7367]
MLQDTRTIRNYQKITDSLVELKDRGYTRDELRLYVDGYLASLRCNNTIEAHLIHRLEDEVSRFLYDSSNFSSSGNYELMTEREN